MATHRNNTPSGVAATGLPAATSPKPPVERAGNSRAMRAVRNEAKFRAWLEADTKAPNLAELIERERIRARIEAAVARLIDALDAIDGDADLEPSLGSIGSACGCEGHPQTLWSAGALDDREDLNEDGGDILDEPHDPDGLEPNATGVYGNAGVYVHA